MELSLAFTCRNLNQVPYSLVHFEMHMIIVDKFHRYAVIYVINR